LGHALDERPLPGPPPLSLPLPLPLRPLLQALGRNRTLQTLGVCVGTRDEEALAALGSALENNTTLTVRLAIQHSGRNYFSSKHFYSNNVELYPGCVGLGRTTHEVNTKCCLTSARLPLSATARADVCLCTGVRGGRECLEVTI
jgi:hypothetical protein